jgi:hypothetical protein
VHGASSVYEWLHRVAIIPAYIRRTTTSGLIRSPLAVELDRSEKVGVSYALGQAMTGVFCQQRLGVDHLLHVDRYSRRFNINFAVGTKQRPDLFGPGTGGWVVAEAKGRSNSMESALRSKMEEQKRTIRTINRTPPWVAVGCVASFPPPNRRLRIDAFDPEKTESEAIDISVDLDRFLLAYYEPFVAALDFGVPDLDPNSRFETVQLPAAGLRVGLLRGIAEAVRATRSLTVGGLAGAVSDALADRPSEAFPMVRWCGWTGTVRSRSGERPASMQPNGEVAPNPLGEACRAG